MAFQGDTFQQDLVQTIADSNSSPLESILGQSDAQLGQINLGSAGSSEHDTAPVRTATDSLTLSDVVTRLLTLFRSTSDSLTLSDVATAIKIIARDVSDTLTLSDATTRTVTLLRSVTDSLSLSDTVARVASLNRTASDGLTLSDSAVAVVTSGAQEQIMLIYVT
jgi:hypothetical protein